MNKQKKKINWKFRETEKKPMLLSTEAIVLSTAAGAFTGTLLGRPSLWTGLGVTLAGYLTKIPMLTGFGTGMSISGGYERYALNGTGVDGMKERLNALGQNFKHRLYLDKIIKPKDEVVMQDLANVQYFKYPLQGSLDFSEVDRIQRDLAQSAINFQKQKTAVTTYDDVGERLY